MKLLVTSVRNEASYLLEWVSWHKLIGFDHFLIYTNNNTDNTVEILRALKRYGCVSFFDVNPGPEKKPQLFAFNKALSWMRLHKPDWVSCLDVDEFLNLKHDDNLDQFISRLSSPEAIAVNWKIFGSSGLASKGYGLTPERFCWCAKDEYRQNAQFKSIWKYSEDMLRFHHRVIYPKQKQRSLKYVYSDGVELPSEMRDSGAPFAKVNHISFQNAQINHYATRSLDELVGKMSRGNGLQPVNQENTRIQDYLKRFDKNDVYDASILRRLKDYCCSYEELLEYVRSITGSSKIR